VTEQQLDLFSDAPMRVVAAPPHNPQRPLAAEDLDDAALIAAIAESDLGDSEALAAEAGRRRLAAAVPALAALCRRFAGFGAHRPVPEQAAALESFVMIGGRDAVHTVAQLLEKAVVQGPTLRLAVNTAAQLHSPLSVHLTTLLLRHPDPAVRADACRCVRPAPELIALLVDLLDDLDPAVAKAAACALGQMGRSEGCPALKRLLREEPCAETIEALSAIADEEAMVLLGRIARSTPELAAAALDALEIIDHVRAAKIAGAIRKSVPCSARPGRA
jgi:hypothetical protein